MKMRTSSFKKVVTYRLPSANNDNGKFCHVILDEPTSAKSLASVVLLNNHYRRLEVEYYSNKYNVNISKPEFKGLSNYNLLKIIRQIAQRKFLEKSELICAYCNIQVELLEGKRRRHNHATVDHFIPQIDSCDPIDETNFRVCCYKCNNEKGQLTYKEWMQKKNGKIII